MKRPRRNHAAAIKEAHAVLEREHRREDFDCGSPERERTPCQIGKLAMESDGITEWQGHWFSSSRCQG